MENFLRRYTPLQGEDSSSRDKNDRNGNDDTKNNADNVRLITKNLFGHLLPSNVFGASKKCTCNRGGANIKSGESVCMWTAVDTEGSSSEDDGDEDIGIKDRLADNEINWKRLMRLNVEEQQLADRDSVESNGESSSGANNTDDDGME